MRARLGGRPIRVRVILKATWSHGITGCVRLKWTCCTVARKAGGHYVDPNQELIALGMSNMMCSMFHGFPVTGMPGPSGCQSDLPVRLPPY